MSLKLHDIFSSEGVRAWKKNSDARIYGAAVLSLEIGKRCDPWCQFLFRYLVGDLTHQGAGDSHDPNAAAPGRGGYCSDSVSQL